MIESSLESEPVLVPAGRPGGRMVRSVLACAALATLLFLPPMFVFLPAALLHCGLRNGRRAAWLAFALAVPVAGLLLLAPPHEPLAEAQMGYTYFTALVLAVALPSLLVLPMVARGDAFGRVLVAAVIGSVAGLAATELVMTAFAHFSPYELWMSQAREVVEATFRDPRITATPSGVAFAQTATFIALLCVPGSIVINIAVVFILSLVMVGRIAAWRQFVETRSVPTATPYLFRNLSLPLWVAFAFVASGLSPLAHGMLLKIGANVLAVVIFLYFAQGLALFRALLAAIGAGFIGVVFGFGTVALLAPTGLSPLLLTVAGLFDSFFDFRHFNRKDHSDESHSD